MTGVARFARAVKEGRAYSISTPLAGTTAAAAHLSPVAAAAATLLSVYNPQTSGYVANVWRVTGDFISGTVEVGTYTWNFHGSATVTAAQSAALTRNLLVSGAASPDGCPFKGFTGETITGGVLALQGPPIGMWATAGTQRMDQWIDAAIQIPQGGMVTIGAPTNATSTVSAWSIWVEAVVI